MGFSKLKDSVLDAGLEPKEGPATADLQSRDNFKGQMVMEAVASLKKVILQQADELQLLRDVLEAMKVQNSILTQKLKCPGDPDTLFTLQGAKDFTRCTGVTTKLCAGIKPTDENSNPEEIDPVDEPPLPPPEPELLKDTMDLPPVDNLVKLLLQHLQQQQQQKQQVPLLPQHSLPQLPLSQQQQQAQLQALPNIMQSVPMFQHFTQPQTQHVLSPQHQQQQQQQQQQAGPGIFLWPTPYYPNTVWNPEKFQHGTLSESQRRMIAMEYNKEESERQTASQREQEKMLESIKTSMRDFIQEQQCSLVSEWSPPNHSDVDILQSLARDTPYKRVSKQTNKEPHHNVSDIYILTNELHELTKQIKRSGKGSIENTEEVVVMETEDPERGTSSTQQSDMSVASKQQAGYVPPVGSGNLLDTSSSVADCISAVVSY